VTKGTGLWYTPGQLAGRRSKFNGAESLNLSQTWIPGGTANCRNHRVSTQSRFCESRYLASQQPGGG